MSLGNADNLWEMTTRLSAIERVASPAIQEGTGRNLANIDVGKKTPPTPKVTKDEFGTQSIADIKYSDPAAQFKPSNQALEGSSVNFDPFQKSNKDYATLSPSEIAKRTDVLNSLGIMDGERDGTDPFSVASAGVYGRGEANQTEFYASGDNHDTTEKLDQDSLINEVLKDA